MNILLLGGAGFIGTHLAHALLDAGHLVRIFDRANSVVQPIAPGHPRLQRMAGDLFNVDDLEASLDDMELVFYVGDVADALLKVLDYQGPHKIFNIASGVGMNLNEIIGEIETVLGQGVTRVYKPARRFDVPTNILDITLARRELGWSPRTGFGDGLARTAAWISGTDVPT